MRSFWKTKSINPPEGIGKLLNYKFSGGSMTMQKYQKPIFWSIEKCEEVIVGICK
jgi:hypothetical protein